MAIGLSQRVDWHRQSWIIKINYLVEKEYKTHDGWRRACKRLLEKNLFGFTIYDGLTGQTKGDLRDFVICAVPIDLDNPDMMRHKGFRSIGEWDGEKGFIYEDATERIALTVEVAKRQQQVVECPPDPSRFAEALRHLK